MSHRGSILVTGGAGYIGSHTVRQLLEAGYRVVVVDNFYSGHRWAVDREAALVEGNAGDVDLIGRVLRDFDIEAVIHFAGHIVVPESVSNPLKYYENNTCVSRNLIAACVQANVSKFIFSSSAAVYGLPSNLPASEMTPTVPISPYGTSKLITEWMLRDVASANRQFRYVALRYFNVAGARVGGGLGQATPEATHLIKVACQAACGDRDEVQVFGIDYPTPDGTCIRDYIHVDDLAAAHLDALRYLALGRSSEVLNVGYGSGFSVREVLDTVRKVSGVDFRIKEGGRREGDPVSLISDCSRIKKVLGWKPRYQSLELICDTAYQWEKALRAGTATNVCTSE